MKRNIYFLSFFAITFFSFFWIDNTVFALPSDSVSSFESSFLDVDETHDVVLGNLSFQNLTFHKLCQQEECNPMAFLSGEVTDTLSFSSNYQINISYYDEDYHLIAEVLEDELIYGNDSIILSFLEKENLQGSSWGNIRYYRLKFFSTSSSSIPSQNSSYHSYDYVIDQYHVDIKINENNTFDITEKIEVYFQVPKHGIYRTIPIKNTVTRTDGTVTTNRVKISNLKVNYPYSISHGNRNYKIQIGSSNELVSGKKTYLIQYNYNIGKDPLKDKDEFYFNIIGDDWDTVIGNVTFQIVFPKEFDASSLGFSSGKVGSVNSSDVEYEVNGNVVSGSYRKDLAPSEALTVRCELPEGYFVNAASSPFGIYLMFGVPILCFLLSFSLWYFFGKDKPVVETIEFYPPDDLNSLEVGYLYKGKANSQDVTSLLVYLANKGYLKIVETEEKKWFRRCRSFQIVKVKEYDGDNDYEKDFFNGLFRKAKTSSSGECYVTKKELHNSFYTTTRYILSKVNSKENQSKIFENTFWKTFLVCILMIISLIVIISVPTLEIASAMEVFESLVIISCYIPFYAVGICAPRMSKGLRIIFLGFIIFHSFSFFSELPLIEVITSESVYSYGFLVGILCLMGIIICIRFMKKRTPYGNEILGKLKGFKNFLKTAQKDKLEALVMQNPSYFYDILPYTYVLGISDKWIKKFESINLQEPSWYDSPSSFEMVHFGSFMSSTMTTAEKSMTSGRSSSSSSNGDFSGGGGSSGGGFSGGGSGGGGGGSW